MGEKSKSNGSSGDIILSNSCHLPNKSEMNLIQVLNSDTVVIKDERLFPVGYQHNLFQRI